LRSAEGIRDSMVTLQLGERSYDLRRRALVVGILNRTRDSFYDRGAHFALDAALRHADRLVADGADVIEIGARPGGVGVTEVSEHEETDLVCETAFALRERCELPLAVDTQRGVVAEAAYSAGVVIGNDMGGFRDPRYLPVAAKAGATVVATHCRVPPGVPDPNPVYRDVVEEVRQSLCDLARRAEECGLPAERIVLDPGLDLGKTWKQSLALLAATPRFAELGYAVLVAASNKIFLGRTLELPKDERLVATASANTAALLGGARLLRVHDARAGREVAQLVAALLEEAPR
jgi:dihydropteroate synthase